MAATSSNSNSVAGHPIAMKVGGRRLSVSKSPKAQSYLSTSPNATKDAPTTTTADNQKASEDYPRPEGGHEGDKDKDKQQQQGKKDEQQQKNKEKPTFEQVKQKIQNNNPPQMMNNHSIKQPSGKVM